MTEEERQAEKLKEKHKNLWRDSINFEDWFSKNKVFIFRFWISEKGIY